jgi:GxxExxY protein
MDCFSFFCQRFMPITSSVCVRPINQEEFARIDYLVMRHAFATQNDLGRLCDEIIYHNDLAARLEAAGLGPVRKEVPITVTHLSFAKTYWLDLVVADAAIYELKTEARLANDHDAQLLNYLFHQGAHHGKLVNFRPPQVESKFLNTSLTTKARKDFEVDTRRWRETDQASRTLRTTLLDLLQDWGGFLELRLYLEALTHFLGGEEKVVGMVALAREGVVLGNQRFHLMNEETAFRLTALTEGASQYEPQLQSLLRHSPLRVLHWINLAAHRIQFVTLTRQS